MNEDKDFINGFYAKKAEVDFVKCKINIKLSEFREWAKENLSKDDEWLNIDVKESKSGNFYAERNTWKPDSERADTQPQVEEKNKQENSHEEIPF